jgi:hypothetical protein
MPAFLRKALRRRGRCIEELDMTEGHKPGAKRARHNEVNEDIDLMCEYSKQLNGEIEDTNSNCNME